AFAVIFWLSRGRLGPLSSIFPETVLMLMAAFSAMLLVKAFWRPSVRPVYEEGDRRRLVVVTLILFAWWWLIGWLGFAVASVVVILALVWYLALVEGQVSLPKLALWLGIVIVEVGFFYLVFTQLLFIRPPRGLFF
ncbi:MAG TPA: tripartite tricarboxylate transporter TctB family protein, partial [Afifellaceae bacterium]|nr:tripartite tricarboxylate transporter TctB family protein [Afifellaceae bacterium]